MSATVRKVILCLEALAESQSGALASEVAASTGLSRPAVIRLLDALVEAGIVLRDSYTRRYRPGLRLYEWSVEAVRRQAPVDAARAEMLRLVSMTHQPADLAVLDGHDIVVLERAEWAGGQAVSAPRPNRGRWNESAAGQVIAAFSPFSLVEDLFAAPAQGRRRRREPPPPHAIARLDTVKRQGYADFQGNDGARSALIAAPILDASEYAVAALSMPLRAGGLSVEALEKMIEPLQSAAQRISHTLGYHHVRTFSQG